LLAKKRAASTANQELTGLKRDIKEVLEASGK
jgi:hypothetical protein